MADLVRWKNEKRRKPLIIHGARQVGKTWLMKEFGKQYFDKVIYISFDHNEHMRNVFSLDFDMERIISALRIEAGEVFQAEGTLLIFDEIQEIPAYYHVDGFELKFEPFVKTPKGSIRRFMYK